MSTDMSTDEQQIRALIENWADAVHGGDLERVLADHSDDIVMFDVPPPHQGVRGIDAYRETWPGFFQWQAGGAVFEIESLDVTAGTDVAFAYALLRCGTSDEFAENPENRLRLTLGLRKENGRWVVVHEHHSFPHGDGSDPADRIAEAEQGVRDVHHRWSELTAAKDLDGMMADIDEDVVSFEHGVPLQYVGRDAVREVCARGLDASPAGVDLDTSDLTVAATDVGVAVAWGLDRVRTESTDGAVTETWSRATRVFRKRGDRWVMVHQHLSFPMDPSTGLARIDLRP